MSSESLVNPSHEDIMAWVRNDKVGGSIDVAIGLVLMHLPI